MKVDVLSESDKLLTRIVIGLQAELGLKQVDIDGLSKLLATSLGGFEAAGELSSLSEADVSCRLERLDEAGWVHIDRRNPHVSVALDGVVVCAALPIPEMIIGRLEQHMIRESLE